MSLIKVFFSIPYRVAQFLWMIHFFIFTFYLFAICFSMFMNFIYQKNISVLEYVPYLLVVLISKLLWDTFTFKRSDYVRIMKKSKVKLRKQDIVYSVLWRPFAIDDIGFHDGLMLASKLRGALFLLIYVSWTNKDKMLTPDKVYTTDRIAISIKALLSDSFDKEIKISTGIREIPKTSIDAIDKNITNALNDISDFHGRIVSNGAELVLLVIGSPWLGKKFEMRIKKGLEIMKSIHADINAEEWDETQVNDKKMSDLLSI